MLWQDYTERLPPAAAVAWRSRLLLVVPCIMQTFLSGGITYLV